MTLGARPIGTRSIGDTAPSGAGVLPSNFIPTDHPMAVSFTGNASAVFATSIRLALVLGGRADLDVNPTNTVLWMSVEFNANASLDVAVPYKGTRRRVIITDHFGVPIAELQNANVSPITYELNQPESWSFSLPTNDPKVDAILAEGVREVQLWRGDQILAWGPMVRPQVTSSQVSVSVEGAMWHLGRRHIGKAERTNYIKNGDFEDGLAHWAFKTNEYMIAYNQPGRQDVPPRHEIKKYPVMTGKRALEMENFVAGNDAFGYQQFLWTTNVTASPDGDEWSLKGYVWVKSFDNAANEGGRGLYLERFSTTVPHPDPKVLALDPNAKKSIEHVFVPINEETPKNVWVQMEIGLKTPPKAGEPELVMVRIYAPDGVVVWDRISLTLDERTGYYATDQAKVAEKLVQHLQDPAYAKSNVNITTDCPTTGVLVDRVYYHSEHVNGLRSIEEFTALSNGFDIDVAYTATKRIFRTHFPEKGKHKPKFALETGRNIASFAWTFDGEAASTSVIVLGSGGGSGREEGFAIDTTKFAGLTLEEVFVAPAEARIETLDKIAVERLVTTTAPEVLAVQTTPPIGNQADPIGSLVVGDTVPVVIEMGALNIRDTYRVTRLSINPDDTLDLVLNRRELTAST